MNASNRQIQASRNDYYGRILNGNYSNHLKSYLAECIDRLRAFDEIGSPSIPYISAWQDNRKTIWYEFVSKHLSVLLGCDGSNAHVAFKKSIVARHVYCSDALNKSVNQHIFNRNEVKRRVSGLRNEAKTTGTVEAVYKILLESQETFWLKDQATIESFISDGIHISLGNLTVVTKEMEAEEHLKRTQKALKESEKKFKAQAIHDNLTGLYNTRHLYKALSLLIEKSTSARQVFSLIFMDIDNFKQVVDSHGHLNASKALQEIASTIQATLQNPAYGVAYGGDEFVLVLPGFDKHQAMQMAETIRSRIKETIYLQKANLKVRISASLGVSTYPHDADTLSDLLALADQAMFSVKEKGKDSVCAISYRTAHSGETSKNLVDYNCQDKQ